jgi:hypothetical protein
MTMLLQRSEQVRLAEAAGRSWAETKAEALDGTIPAVHWPTDWDRRSMRALPFKPGEVLEQDLPDLAQRALSAAAERWAGLVVQRRLDEPSFEQELSEEARANQLLEAIEPNLPWEIVADRDGAEVTLTDPFGQQWSVLSVEQAWRVLSEWREHCIRLRA